MKSSLPALLFVLSLLVSGSLGADPCGMVPPIDITGVVPIERMGLQKTYVFYRNGVETFVIRPGYRGKIDNFGMLIPFPVPPAIRKVPDEIFSHIAAAVDPPEVVVNLLPLPAATGFRRYSLSEGVAEKKLEYDAVRVLRQEAVGMYEVVVLEAGSAAALKRWMDEHRYVYPRGMDAACQDYVESGWCFVAVRTRVGTKEGVDPRPGQRRVSPELPPGATFDGHVQAMGFRFAVDELVVPMRLSAFNAGELRNVVYVLTGGPRKIRGIPETRVVRQISGDELYRNLTDPLPLRVVGGEYDEIPGARRGRLKTERDPGPHNGLAADLFASDLLTARTGRLIHPFEEAEKELLRISERLELRGPEIDRVHAGALAREREKTLARALEDLKTMTLTVVDGDFPRDVLARENLRFAPYSMDPGKNGPSSYDAKRFGPAPQASGKLYRASLVGLVSFPALLGLASVALLVGAIVNRYRQRRKAMVRIRSRHLPVTLLTLLLPASAPGATPGGPQDSAIESLIDRLGDPGKAEAAAGALVARGQEAVDHLLGEALEGQEIARRGWAIVCLAEIGGEGVDRRLNSLQEDTRQHELVRTWAAAARVRLARTADELLVLARSVPELPAIGRPIGKRLLALLAQDRPASAETLIDLSLKVPTLQGALAAPILAAGPERLVAAMRTAEDANVRRQAAAYLATLAGDRVAEVAAAVVEAYRFDVEATAVPWKGGPLFVPGIAWPQADARKLAGNLLRWLLLCDRRELTAEQRQIHNNLRSLQLARAAGYQSPGWREVGIEDWLGVWGKAFGRAEVLALLKEQGVAEVPKYASVLDGL